MIRSLYSKFLLFTVIIMIGSAVIAFLVVNTYYHQQLKESNDKKNVAIAKEMASFLENAEDIQQYLDTTAKTGYKILLINEQLHMQYFGDDFRAHNLQSSHIENVLAGNIYHGMRDFPKETFVTGFFSDETANSVGVPVWIDDDKYGLFIRPNIKLLFTEVHYLLGGMFVSMAIISMIAMLFVARKLVQPLGKLTKATKQISKEQFSVQLPTGRGDEIGELAKSFTQMAAKLEASDQMKKQFISDVSHDFQTPLQNIQGYASLLHEGSFSEEELTTYTNIIQSETERLSALTKQLLLLTSLDTLTKDFQQTTFRLDEQLKDVIQKHRWQLIEKDIYLSADLNEVTICANEAFLEKVWENLLSNALKYTMENGHIEVELYETENMIIFSIKDDGIGIEPNNIPNLFDRFYRVDSARHTGIEGTGLGLSIVKQVVDLHGSTIDVKSEVQKGTTFTVHFPKL